MNNKTKIRLSNIVKTLAFPLLVIAFFGLTTKGIIFSKRAIKVILQQAVQPTLITLALYPNLMLGLMDFSAGAVVVSSAILAGNFATMTGTGPLGLLVFCLLICLCLSTITGILNNKLKVPLLALTIGLLLVYETFPSFFFKKALITTDTSILGRPPYVFIVAAISLAIFAVIINKTTYGYNVRALGGNDDLAKSAGLNTNKIKLTGFIIQGFFLGLASTVYMSTNGQVDLPAATSSSATIFDAFLALFLGMFLSGYCNIAIGLPLAAISMSVINNGLVAMGFSSTFKDVVQSIILLLLLGVSANQQRIILWKNNKKRAAEANQAFNAGLN